MSFFIIEKLIKQKPIKMRLTAFEDGHHHEVLLEKSFVAIGLMVVIRRQFEMSTVFQALKVSFMLRAKCVKFKFVQINK